MSATALFRFNSPPVINKGMEFILFVARRLYRDHCAQTAASLTYTSLLALIPFLVVGFSLLREIPLFPDLVNSLQSVLLQIFTPDVGKEVKQYIQSIVNKGGHLPIISFAALSITAVMMLYTISDTLNRIWGVDYKRRSAVSFVVYISVVISGPLLLAGSLAISTYLVSRSFATAGSVKLGWLTSVPWLVTFIAFTAIYRWVPNTRVPWKHALAGGLIAMLLFELAKWGFAQYIKWVPTYNLLYGGLAAIPLTLVWIYLSWLVVLIGAEVARCLEVYIHDYQQVMITARRLLSFFLLGGEEGVSVEQLAAWGYQSKAQLRRGFSRLQQAGLIQVLNSNQYSLTAQARSMGVDELVYQLSRQLKSIGK